MKRFLSLILLFLFVAPCFAQQGGGFPPSAPKSIICLNISTCSASGIKVGQTLCDFSLTATTRTSTVTQTEDTFFNVANVPIGDYWFEASWVMNSASTGGFNFTNSFGWANSTTGTQYGGVTWTSGSGTPSIVGANSAAGWQGSNFASTGGLDYFFTVQGTLVQNGAGAVGLLWSQNNSLATASTLFYGAECLTRLQ